METSLRSVRIDTERAQLSAIPGFARRTAMKLQFRISDGAINPKCPSAVRSRWCPRSILPFIQCSWRRRPRHDNGHRIPATRRGHGRHQVRSRTARPHAPLRDLASDQAFGEFYALYLTLAASLWWRRHGRCHQGGQLAQPASSVAVDSGLSWNTRRRRQDVKSDPHHRHRGACTFVRRVRLSSVAPVDRLFWRGRPPKFSCKRVE